MLPLSKLPILDEESDLTVYYVANSKANDDDPLTVHINMPTKRDDPYACRNEEKKTGVYGLKSIAVFSLLLFYTWPLNFRTAYLGADMYFVLCGYIIATNCDSFTTTQFYFYQFRRILPIYAIFLFFALQINPIFFTALKDGMLNWDIVGAMTFSTNLFNIFGKSDHLTIYGKEPLSLNIFMHTWIVSVELQFCILAPLLLYFMRSCRHEMQSQIKWRTLAVIMFLSLFTQIIGYRRDPTAEMVFSRIWQFIAGAAAYYAASDKFNGDSERIALKSSMTLAEDNNNDNEKEKHFQNVDLSNLTNEKSNKNDSVSDHSHLSQPQMHNGYYSIIGAFNYLKTGSVQKLAHLILLSLFLVLFLLPLPTPVRFSVFYKLTLQLFVVGATAFLLYCGTMSLSSSTPCSLTVPTPLKSNVALIIGSSAFLWYLCHWPLVLCKLQVSFLPQIPFYGGLIAFAFSFSLSVFMRNTVVEWIQNIKDARLIIGIVISLYLASLLSIFDNIYS